MQNIKAGARHSAGDQGHIQEAHDRLVKAGAMCDAMKAYSLPFAIKAVGGGRVEGFLARYTSPSELDAAGDYFDRSTRFGIKDGDTLPLLWHHGLDKIIGRTPIGAGVVKFMDAGVWFQAQLRMRTAYEEFMYKLAQMGKAGFSSGADAASVVRVPVAGKARAFHIKAWNPIECSLTATPADPGNLVLIKSLMGGGSLTAEQDAEIEREMKSERKVELLQRLARLQETDEAKRARLLRELDRIDPGRRDRTNEPRPGPVVGTWASPFDPNKDTGRRTW